LHYRLNREYLNENGVLDYDDKFNAIVRHASLWRQIYESQECVILHYERKRWDFVS
jgi:hypothetical protein